MALPATDSFTTGTDQGIASYSANWALRGGDIQVSQSLDRIYSNGVGGNFSVAAWTADTFNSNHYSQLGVVNLVGSQAFVCGGPAVRIQGDRSCYVLAIGGDGTNPDRARIMRISSTGVGTLISSNVAHGQGATVSAKLEANGSSLTGYVNGVSVVTATDSNLTGGNAGVAMAFQNTNWRGDDFTASNLGGAAITGTGAITSAIATAAGSAAEGKTSVTAAVSGVRGSVTGAGVKGITGSGNANMPKPTILSSAGSPKTGSGTINSSIITSAGVGVRGSNDMPGQIELTAGTPAQVSGTAIKGVSRTASGALTAPPATVAGVASRGWGGTGDVIAPSFAAAVSGPSFKARAITGTGALVASEMQVIGNTVFGHTGTGALSIPKPAVIGTAPGLSSGDAEFTAFAHKAATFRAVFSAHGRARRWPR